MMDPRRSLRARIGLLLGVLTLFSTGLLVLVVELNTRAELASEEAPAQVLKEVQLQLIVYGVVLSLLFILIGWVLTGRIVQSLTDIATVAERIRRGERQLSLPTVEREDEVGVLARSLRQLVGDLEAKTSALEAARDELEERVAERTRRLAAVYDILDAAATVDDLPDLLTYSLSRILGAAGEESGFIHLYDRSGQFFELAAHEGLPAEYSSNLQQLPSSSPLFEAVLASTQPLLIPSIAGDSRSATLHLPSRPAAYLGVPVETQERVWGVLSVLSSGMEQFTNEEQELLASLADQVGIAVERFYLRRQTAQLAVVEERNRLARELHDSVTQALYSATLFAEVAQRMAGKGNMEKALDAVGEVGDMTQQALKEMRLLVHKLRPLSLEKEGLVAALELRLKAVEGRAGVETCLDVAGPFSLPANLEEALYQIASEALNNALKHARSTQVAVCLDRQGNYVRLQVIDNGSGFVPAAAIESGGFGLVSMRERAALVGGRIELESAPGEGTTLTALIPLESERSGSSRLLPAATTVRDGD